ncbi:hypothetical protein ACFPH8_02295 [Bizionia hallyeonensis]|uniref:YD repeat-containing protein n=1 Tax=Bizionia hallyeonensis TaxID=1123757 RepID=A0ABW0C3J0_9FLAO
MKKFLIIAIFILFTGCSSDDSVADNSSQDNAPSGALIKIEISRPNEDFHSSTTYYFNTAGKVERSLEEGWSGSQYLQATNTYAYNSEGQIWKVTIAVDNRSEYTEFNFTNGLISSSMRHTAGGNILRTLYNYNDENQLIDRRFFNADNEESSISIFSFDTNGNIESRHDERDFGTEIIDYTFEYDSYNNPLKTPFENQEMNKIVGHNFNNITRSTRSNGFSTSEVNIEYTYNEAGYPLTSKEYADGNLSVEVTYTYHE